MTTNKLYPPLHLQRWKASILKDRTFWFPCHVRHKVVRVFQLPISVLFKCGLLTIGCEVRFHQNRKKQTDTTTIYSENKDGDILRCSLQYFVLFHLYKSVLHTRGLLDLLRAKIVFSKIFEHVFFVRNIYIGKRECLWIQCLQYFDA